MNAAILALALVGAAPAPLPKHADAPPPAPCMLRVGVGPARAYAAYQILPRGEFRCGGWTGRAVQPAPEVIVIHAHYAYEHSGIKPAWFTAVVRLDSAGGEGTIEYVAGRDQGVTLWCALDAD